MTPKILTLVDLISLDLQLLCSLHGWLSEAIAQIHQLQRLTIKGVPKKMEHMFQM